MEMSSVWRERRKCYIYIFTRVIIFTRWILIAISNEKVFQGEENLKDYNKRTCDKKELERESFAWRVQQKSRKNKD